MTASNKGEAARQAEKERHRGSTVDLLRYILVALLLFGSIGTLAELFLLEHLEDWQRVPIVLLSSGILATLLSMVRPGLATMRLLQAVMVLFVASGLWGLYFHYTGNVEFEREMVPSLRGFALFWEAIRGATPALAPGMMILLGLLGVAYCFRHPQLTAGTANHPTRRSR